MSNTDETKNQKYAKQIFRTYDIRGIAYEQLSEDLIYEIGRVLGSMVQEHNQNQIITGRDARLSSPDLSKSLKQGILDSGCNICDIGIVPTPLLYFATNYLESNSGVMLTGSHNPKHHNGLKTLINGTTLSQDGVQEIYKRIINKDYLSAPENNRGSITQADVSDAYIKRITSSHPLSKKLKVIIDAGNGAASEIGPRLFSALNCELTSLYCELDGNFPNHHPDPSKPENLKDLIQAVKDQKADIGLAFDGDADRLGVITSTGHIIWPDRQMMLYAKAVLEDKPGAKIVFDVKCSKYLAQIIKENNGIPIMHQTGHSVLKKKMIEEKAELAGEMSGHIFFKHKWYGFDDALYTATRLLEILSNTDISSDDLFKQFPEPASTPEINITVSEEEKFNIVNTLKNKVKELQINKDIDFLDSDLITIDGLRVEFKTGWGLIRASNTTACLVTRFEADNNDELLIIKNKFLKLIEDNFGSIDASNLK